MDDSIVKQDVIKNDPRIINGWAMFDWANSAFALVIAVALFPPFYTGVTDDYISIFGHSLSNTTIYAWALSLAYIILTILSPLLSGIADVGGRRKSFLKTFTYIGAVSCILLFFFNSSDLWWYAILLYILSTIGFSGGLVFYNSYLPLIVTEEKMDKVSAKGFSLGYIGSVILLIACLAFIQFAPSLNIMDKGLPVRISFILVGLWWIIFGQISFRRLPSDIKSGKITDYISAGYEEIQRVFNHVKTSKRLFRFLTAFFFYSAGVQTVLYMAAPLAEDELGFMQQELIILILILQILAIGGAYLFAWLSSLTSNKIAIITQLVLWTFVCSIAYFIDSKINFYVLAGMVGLVMGGTQSISRSTYSKFIDEENGEFTSYFSFYDIIEKLSIVAGTFSFGFIDQVSGTMKNSIVSLAIFFIVGLIILLMTPFKKSSHRQL